MPQLLYDKIRGQFDLLLAGFPGEDARGFLVEVPIPPTVGPLLASARQIAEMLKAAPTVSLAIEELRADQDAARAFYQFALSQFSTLREWSRPILEESTEQPPFYALAVWILTVAAKAP